MLLAHFFRLLPPRPATTEDLAFAAYIPPGEQFPLPPLLRAVLQNSSERRFWKNHTRKDSLLFARESPIVPPDGDRPLRFLQRFNRPSPALPPPGRPRLYLCQNSPTSTGPFFFLKQKFLWFSFRRHPLSFTFPTFLAQDAHIQEWLRLGLYVSF